MIYIDKNSTSNIVTLTLQEKSDLFALYHIQPYYLFQLQSDTTKDVITFVGDNVAPVSARTRYDQFIWDTSITDLLTPRIFWTYTVYDQDNNTNLNPSLANSLVETGKLFADGTDELITTYYTPTGMTQYVAYTSTN